MRGHELAREELLDILQSDVLGVHLDGLDAILPAVLVAAQPPPPVARSAAPGGPALASPMMDPEYRRRRRRADIAVLVVAALMILGLSVAYALLHDPAPQVPSSTQTSMHGSVSAIGSVHDRGETAYSTYEVAQETR